MLRNLKILIVGQLPPPVHGANVMTLHFITALQQIGHKVKLVQKSFSRNMAEVQEVSLRKIAKVPVIAFNLILAIKKGKPDLCFYIISMGLTAFLVDALFILILRLFRVPYVLYCHGQGLNKLGTGNSILIRLVFSQTVGRGVGALVLGERLKEDLTPYLEAHRLYVLPNAIQDQTGGQAPPPRNGREEVRVLFLSNLLESKGPWEFLLLAGEIAAKTSGVRFSLAGQPVDQFFYSRLQQFIVKENLKDIVEVPGGLYGKAKANIFLSSDIFVYPTHRDASPLVIIEAMQWGLPVISSDEGAIPEVVQDGVTGFIVNPKDISQLTDRVLRLVQDPRLRVSIGQAGRRRFEEYYSTQAYQRNLQKACYFFENIINCR